MWQTRYRRRGGPRPVTVLFAAVLGVPLSAALGAAPARPNVLFIAVDDLRPELGCYGSPIAVSPHLDALARDGLVFNRAYCQEAICCPSRSSLMTGARPETVGVIENSTYFRDVSPDIVTLPQHFRAAGYETVYVGKVFHGRYTDEARSWSRRPAPIPLAKPVGLALPENRARQRQNFQRMLAKYGEAARHGLASGPAFECADVPDSTYRDGYDTEVAIATLKELAQADRPFFFGLGYYKPHLNWVAPKRYWDLYDRDRIPLAAHAEAPRDGAAMGLHASFELRTRANIPKLGPIDPNLARTLKHAYLACVSYIDAQIGRVLQALADLGLRDRTLVIVWGDHGWHLGDMGVWGKATDYEIATRVPLILWTPGMPARSRGRRSDALVELVDMYPTLCELAGLSTPAHLEGLSFAPLLADPERPWKRAAFSLFPTPALREWAANPLSPAMRETFFGPLIGEVERRIQAQMGARWDRPLFEQHLIGYALRTERYRLVAWKDRRDPEAAPLYVELYDHLRDPAETVNVASRHPEVVTRLLACLRAGWRGARPPGTGSAAGSGAVGDPRGQAG